VNAKIVGSMLWRSPRAAAILGAWFLLGTGVACSKTRITALCSGILLLTFGLGMTWALGIKAPLNFSVFSATGGSMLLATCPAFPFSVNELV